MWLTPGQQYSLTLISTLPHAKMCPERQPSLLSNETPSQSFVSLWPDTGFFRQPAILLTTDLAENKVNGGTCWNSEPLHITKGHIFFPQRSCLNVQLVFLTDVKQQVKGSCQEAGEVSISQVPSQEIPSSIFVGQTDCLQNVQFNSDNLWKEWHSCLVYSSQKEWNKCPVNQQKGGTFGEPGSERQTDRCRREWSHSRSEAQKRKSWVKDVRFKMELKG